MLNFYHVLGTTYSLSNAGFLNRHFERDNCLSSGAALCVLCFGKALQGMEDVTVPLSLQCVLSGMGNCTAISLLAWQL